MELEGFLSHADAERAQRTLAILLETDCSSLVLTGGFAVELHCLQRGFGPQQRHLNDIDFLAGSFEEIPRGISGDLVFRHVHPHSPPGKTLLQCVDPETKVRVDIFRACGTAMARALPLEVGGTKLGIISLEDLTARTARLCMDLEDNAPIPTKHARDFPRLLRLADVNAVEQVWHEHRKPKHPKSFLAVADLLTDLIATRPDLQIFPQYARNANEPCQRCESNPSFPLAHPERILSLLGYC